MDELSILNKYLAGKNLRRSQPREWILSHFLSIEEHVSVGELWNYVKKKHPSVGFATVYRTLKVLIDCGLCREVSFEDGSTRYEHSYGHKHHDHLICTKCGALVEVVDHRIEKLQEELMKRHGFSPQRHRMDLYGLCGNCAV